MSVLKCKMCGGTLTVDDSGIAVCEYCGTTQTLSEPAENINTDSSKNSPVSNIITQRRTQEARARAEEARLEREKLASQRKKEKSEKRARFRKGFLTVLLIIVALSIFSVILFKGIIPTARYNSAVKNLEKGNYTEAYETFKSLGNYKDSAEQLKKLLSENFSVAQVGDIIYFGEYEQDNSLSNGKEKIEWQVLDKTADGKMLVVSKYALDCKTYHSDNRAITWETSSIRKWLNNDFISTAFNENNRKKILKTTIQNPDNADYKSDGGNDTQDKVFLLSIEEVKRYFPSTLDRICSGTKYADAQGGNLENLTQVCRWWLRSPGGTNYNASFVKVDGFILQLGAVAGVEKRSVRPAMWIDCK